MYLMRTAHKVRQMRELRSDANFYGWVHDNQIDIFRFQNGRFEKLHIVTEERDYCPHSRFFAGEWWEVPLEI